MVRQLLEKQLWELSWHNNLMVKLSAVIANKFTAIWTLERLRQLLKSRRQYRIILIDVRDVDANYSVYDFVAEASQAIMEIASRGKVPIIVGGTGLYLQSYLKGIT